MSKIFVDSLSLENLTAVAQNPDSFSPRNIRKSKPAKVIYQTACQVVETFVFYEQVCTDTVSLDYPYPKELDIREELGDLIEPFPRETTNLETVCMREFATILEEPLPLLNSLLEGIKLAQESINQGYVNRVGFILPDQQYRDIDQFLSNLPDRHEHYCKLLALPASWSAALLGTLFHLERALYYAQVSALQKSSYAPHIFRSQCWLKDLQLYRLGLSKYVGEQIREALVIKVESVFGHVHEYVADIPPLGDKILSTTTSLSQVGSEIRKLRSKALESGFYEWIDAVEREIQKGDWAKVAKSVDEINRALGVWAKSMGLEKRRRKFNISLPLPLLSIGTDFEIPDIRLSKGAAYRPLVWLFDAMLL